MKDKANSLFEIDEEEMIKMERFESGRHGSMLEEVGREVVDEVLDKYKIENSNREACRGRDAPLKWRRVRRSEKYRIRKWREDCWARIFALFREYNLQQTGG